MKFGVIATIFGIVSVAGAQNAQDVKNKELPAFLRQLSDTRKTIADGYVRWTDALKAKNLDAVVGLYSDDATLLPDDKEAVSGKDAVRAFYADWFSQNDKVIEQKFENINSVQEGGLLIDSTKYSGVFLKDGKELPLNGKRLVVWQRDPKGQWKILRDAWNRSPLP